MNDRRAVFVDSNVLIYDIPVGGKKIHDANIVATCLAYGIPRLLTQNHSDFQRFEHLVRVETL